MAGVISQGINKVTLCGPACQERVERTLVYDYGISSCALAICPFEWTSWDRRRNWKPPFLNVHCCGACWDFARWRSVRHILCTGTEASQSEEQKKHQCKILVLLRTLSGLPQSLTEVCFYSSCNLSLRHATVEEQILEQLPRSTMKLSFVKKVSPKRGMPPSRLSVQGLQFKHPHLNHMDLNFFTETWYGFN